jgi:hypothetical protein
VTFRSDYAADVPTRAADAALHALAALLLPGPWWFQYVPDAAVLPLWVRSMRGDCYASDRDWLLRAHRVLHLRASVWSLLSYLCLLLATGSPVLVLHVLVHVGIDTLTHDGRWQ